MVNPGIHEKNVYNIGIFLYRNNFYEEAYEEAEDGVCS